MFSVNPRHFEEGTCHVGADGNIYRVSHNERREVRWVIDKTRDLTETISSVMRDETLTSEQKINKLTEQPDGVNANILSPGDRQYYNIWQIFYLCCLGEYYSNLDLSSLGIDCDFGRHNNDETANFAEKLRTFKAEQLQDYKKTTYSECVRVCADNKWNFWFDLGCPEGAHPLENTESRDLVIWLPTDIRQLKKDKDRERLQTFVKRRTKRLLEWLRNVNTSEVETQLGVFTIIRADVPKNALKALKKQLNSQAIYQIPYHRRSAKEEAKYDKLCHRAQEAKSSKKAEKLCKKAKRKYGYGTDRIVWSGLYPSVEDKVDWITRVSVPIELVPKDVADRQRKNDANDFAKNVKSLDAITTARGWIKWYGEQQQLRAGIPVVFDALYPNARIEVEVPGTAPDRRNDWTENCKIGLMCYMFRVGGNIESDEDLYCGGRRTQ